MKCISQGVAPSRRPSTTSPQSAAPVMTPFFFDGSAPFKAKEGFSCGGPWGSPAPV